jgi:RTX calcium-binding nonapeptide repeat (4 copies)
LGNGDDSVTVGVGNNTIVGGDGADTIMLCNGSSTVTLGNGSNVIEVGSGDNTISTGSGFNDIHVGAGHNTVVDHWGIDTLYFAPGVTAASLTFSRSGDDLLIAEGTNGGTVTVVGGINNESGGVITRFFTDDIHYSLNPGSGKFTRDRDSFDAAVDQMIQAMAAYAPATSAMGSYTPQDSVALAPSLLASSWRS